MRQWVDHVLGCERRGTGERKHANALPSHAPTPPSPNRGFAAQTTVVVAQTQSPTHLPPIDG